MRATPNAGRDNGWWVSPVIPTIANCVLATLWGFSAFGGWGRAAFCESDGLHVGCANGFRVVMVVSMVPATVAAVLALGSWAVPAARRDPDRLDSLLTSAAILWVLAEGVLFVGGYFAQP